jgi:hypothetical protein
MLAMAAAQCTECTRMERATHKINPRRRESRQLAALICLALFLVLKLFVVSEALHHSLHADAAAPDHHCAITLISQGQVAPPAVFPVFVAVCGGMLLWLASHSTFVRTSRDFALAPTRGPPGF